MAKVIRVGLHKNESGRTHGVSFDFRRVSWRAILVARYQGKSVEESEDENGEASVSHVSSSSMHLMSNRQSTGTGR